MSRNNLDLTRFKMLQPTGLWLLIVLLLSIVAITLHGDDRTAALEGSDFQPGYIINNRQFTDTTTMSSTRIQDWLNHKNSTCLRTYETPSIKEDGDGNVQYGESVSAAKAIRQAAGLNNINPQVLLVTLQKEQGLITRSDCPDWRYETAMGFGCPDGGSCDEDWFGLSRQLYQGARHFRGFYDDSLSYVPYSTGTYNIDYHPNDDCGSDPVDIVNQATASLYSYTPYQPNKAALDNLYGTGNDCSSYGNRNFWREYSSWFGDPTFPLLFHIEGDDNPDKVYLAWEDHYYHVASPAVIKALNLEERTIETVNTKSLGDRNEGPRLTTLVKFKGGASVYQIDNRKLYHFGTLTTSRGDVYATGEEVLEQAYNLAEADNVTTYPTSLQRLLHNYQDPPKVSLTVSAYGKDAIYFMQDGEKHWVPSREVYKHMRGNVDGNHGCPTYNAYQTNFSPRVLDTTKRPHKEKLPRASGREKLAVRSENKNYVIVNGKRRRIDDTRHAQAWGLNSNDFFQSVDDSCIMNGFEPGGRIDSNLIRIGNGDAIFKMKDGKKFRVVSRTAFDAYGFNMDDVINVPESASGPMRTPNKQLYEPGTLLQEDDSDAVYAVNTEFKLKRVPSRKMFDAYGFELSDVITVKNLNPFTKNGTLTRWIKNPANNNVWVVDQGVQHRLHLDEQEHYAWGTRDSVGLLAPFHGTIEEGRDATIYVRRADGDAVYRIEQNTDGDSVKRKYKSREAFEMCTPDNIGWNDIMQLSGDLFDTHFTPGNAIGRNSC